ncbi:lysozyme [Asaia krungthepensis]|uniref:Lysozyme n=1 Tax=Asaia krungthepensis NRIC 0535 TaxID=1307925 RepID=A0ABQ0Q309_9PROT|nr:lysozyme [Asaia krungthepensis]GBQ88883.1 phage related lysozyme [Asaia krungthepensis NRIC 0535]
MTGIDIAISLISRDDFEGLSLKPYLCPADYWTIGYGNRFLSDGSPVTAATKPITQAQALDLLRQTVMAQQVKLRTFVTVPLTDYQEGALLSWQFNVGSNAARASTLVRLLNQRRYVAAAAQFLVWDKATVNGQLVVLPGLQRRRRVESGVFLGRSVQDIGDA